MPQERREAAANDSESRLSRPAVPLPLVVILQRGAQRKVSSVGSKLHRVRACAQRLRGFADRQSLDANQVEHRSLRFGQARKLRPGRIGELRRVEFLLRRRARERLVIAFVERLVRWTDASSRPARLVDRDTTCDGECPRDHVCAP